MRKRNGASLLNVMVFMVFAVMVTAQVFFFSQSSMESLADEREIMMYRLNLDSLLEEAVTALKEPSRIVHDNDLNNEKNFMTYEYFFDGRYNEVGSGKIYTQVDWTPSSEWDSNKYYAAIHDLDYVFEQTFNRYTYINGHSDQSGYGNENAYKKIFAAMPPITTEKSVSRDVTTTAEDGTETTTTVTVTETVPSERYYLIRVYAKLSEKFYGRHLMYQVLVKRDKEYDFTVAHKVDTLSFQEVWF